MKLVSNSCWVVWKAASQVRAVETVTDSADMPPESAAGAVGGAQAASAAAPAATPLKAKNRRRLKVVETTMSPPIQLELVE